MSIQQGQPIEDLSADFGGIRGTGGGGGGGGSGGTLLPEDLPALPTNKSITQSKTQILDAEAVQHLKNDIEQLVAKPSSIIPTTTTTTARKAGTKSNSKAASKVSSPLNSRPVSRNISRHASMAQIKALSRQTSSTHVSRAIEVSSAIMKEMKEEGSIDNLAKVTQELKPTVHNQNHYKEVPQSLMHHHQQQQHQETRETKQEQLDNSENIAPIEDDRPLERLGRKTTKRRDKSEERSSRLERKESKKEITAGGEDIPKPHSLDRQESKKQVIRRRESEAADQNADPQPHHNAQPPASKFVRSESRKSITSAAAPPSHDSENPRKPVKTESRKSISQATKDDNIPVDHPTSVNKQESRKSLANEERNSQQKPLARLESKKSLQKLLENDQIVSALDTGPPPVPSIPKQYIKEESVEIPSQQRFEPKPPSGPPPSEYRSHRAREDSVELPQSIEPKYVESTSHHHQNQQVSHEHEEKYPQHHVNKEYNQNHESTPKQDENQSHQHHQHHQSQESQQTNTPLPPLSPTTDETIEQNSNHKPSEGQHQYHDHTAQENNTMTPLQSKNDPNYEPAVSAPCLAAPENQNTDHPHHTHAHHHHHSNHHHHHGSTHTTAGDGVGTAAAHHSPRGSAHDLLYKVKRGSKENLGGSAHNSPRSSATMRHAAATSARNGSTRSIRNKKAADLDRCMSPSTVLNQLPRATSSASIKPEINNKQMSKFLSGFRRFQKTYFGDNSDLYDSLKNGQSPKTLLIACCDSRVDPAIITDCEPGDLFVVRNVANLVAPYNPDKSHHGVSAALEFAVKGLKVNNIIVMGHTKCGGIAALMRGITDSDETEFLGPWMTIAEKARQKVLKHFGHKEMDIQNRACEHASILLSLENLVSYPWVREKLMNETITIHGWYFDFEDGELLALNPETLVFEPLVEADESRVSLNMLAKEKGGHVEEHESFK